MAWGFFKKIGNGIKKAFSWVGRHAGDIADAAETIVDASAPEASGAMRGIDVAAHAVQNAVTRRGRG